MKIVVTSVLLLLLTACATGPTLYQPRGTMNGFGFSEQPLESDRVRIVFEGNARTPRETVENYLLYRAAEVTVERGYRYFVPMQQNVEREESRTSVATGIGTGFGRGWWHGGGFGGSIIIVDSAPANGRASYRASAVFKLLAEEPTATNMDVLDAEEVFKALGPSISRPVKKNG